MLFFLGTRRWGRGILECAVADSSSMEAEMKAEMRRLLVKSVGEYNRTTTHPPKPTHPPPSSPQPPLLHPSPRRHHTPRAQPHRKQLPAPPPRRPPPRTPDAQARAACDAIGSCVGARLARSVLCAPVRAGASWVGSSGCCGRGTTTGVRSGGRRAGPRAGRV